jgi:BCD family chlorophyll transporter-like MFS transporter
MMRTMNLNLFSAWRRISPRFMPFSDVATKDLPLSKWLRLALFQVSVGMATVMLIGTLNRVMIVEMGVPASLVALMVALPLLFSPFRALVGFKSDHHRSFLGWKRVPYIWLGSWLQFGGLAIMPFSLILLSGDSNWPHWFSYIAAALAFLLVGAGMQITQTAGLALASDLATPASRPRVVALMYVMFLIGMVFSSVLFGLLLSHFSPLRLIQVVQGAAALTRFKESWNQFAKQDKVIRFLIALGMGTAAFSMQDIILEPYGAEVLHLSVSATTLLTGLTSIGALLAFMLAAKVLNRQIDSHRLAAIGALCGIFAFTCVIFSEPLLAPNLFRVGAFLIGFGGGLFAVSTLATAMSFDSLGMNGLVIGAWGAVSASAAGLAIGLGGVIRDVVSSLAVSGSLGSVLVSPGTGYSFVYHIELFLLFATLVAIGPLVMMKHPKPTQSDSKFGLAEFPS